MASMSRDSHGNVAIQFMAPDKRRRPSAPVSSAIEQPRA